MHEGVFMVNPNGILKVEKYLNYTRTTFTRKVSSYL